MHDELVNENGCMADTTDYDTDFLVTDNLTDYQFQGYEFVQNLEKCFQKQN